MGYFLHVVVAVQGNSGAEDYDVLAEIIMPDTVADKQLHLALQTREYVGDGEQLRYA